MDLKTLTEYIKLHIISLEQDQAELNQAMDSIEDLDSDEYQSMEIEDISLNGQQMALHHILGVINGSN